MKIKIGKDCYGNTVEILEENKNGWFLVRRYQHWSKSAYTTCGIRDIKEVEV